MIAYIEGKIIDSDLSSITILAGGVGYKIGVPISTIQSASSKTELSLWTYMAVRENSMDLYGFLSKADLNFFELLLTISGIGPKSALGILNLAPVETIMSGIRSGDATYLSKTSGISKKMSEKIIVALKDKIETSEETTDTITKSKGNSDSVAIDALVSLGYSERESRDHVREVMKKLEQTESETSNPEIIIKEALKNLGK